MKCLVTGADGFIGSYLVEHFFSLGQEVTALCFGRLVPLAPAKGLEMVEADICDPAAIERVVNAVKPDRVFHLAAQSLPGVSWENPADTFRVNTMGTICVLDALCRAGLNPMTLVICSSSEYAPVRDGRPIPESGRMEPSSPYAVSKMAQDHVARLFHEHHGLRVVRARPFYLIGPRKKGDVSSDFARGIVAIERGERQDLPVGNLDAVRDLLDVRDSVEALWTLTERGKPGEVYNVCSGTGCRVGDMLEMLKAMARKPVRETPDPARLRPIDDPVKVGDPAKLRELGWAPQTPIRRTLADILEYWRSQPAA